MATEHLQKKEKLIAGHVEERKGWLYWVLNLKVDGKRKPKYVPTGIKLKAIKPKPMICLLMSGVSGQRS